MDQRQWGAGACPRSNGRVTSCTAAFIQQGLGLHRSGARCVPRQMSPKPGLDPTTFIPGLTPPLHIAVG